MMVASNFNRSLKAVLQSEGGNDDDPDDHGGRTSRGITQREYDAWRTERQLPRLDVWNAPQSDIISVYHEEYWEPYCDNMPLGIDYMYFNTAVLAGPHRAAVLLQRALGVTDDGRIGPVTRQAMTEADNRSLLAKFKSASDAYYRSLHQPKWIRGWLNRNNDMFHTATQMINGAMA